jgi:hypothetical protein
MDANVGPHRACIVQNYLQQDAIELLPWPAMSPDMNQVEHLWNYLGRKMKQLMGTGSDHGTFVLSIFFWGRFQRFSCPLAFFYTPGLVHALLQSNNDRVAYIESFSSLSCRTYHPLPFQSNGLTTGALADRRSIEVLTAHGFVLGDQ